MPIQLTPIQLANGALAPQSVDIESYFVRFSAPVNGSQFPTSTLTANFLLLRAPTATGEVLSTVPAGTVDLGDDVMKSFPHYAELFQFLGQRLYAGWLEKNTDFQQA